jgi:tetratricopeptide (TPR) repeat protein
MNSFFRGRIRSTSAVSRLQPLFLCIVLIFCCSVVLAQTSPSSVVIEGTVRDAQGKPVAGALVIASGKSQATVQTKTSEDGTFLLNPVNSGTYSVSAAMSGFRDVIVDAVVLAAGEKKRIDLVLLTASQDSRSAAGESQATGTNAPPMELQDAPTFTVAGVTDWSNAGLHGSDTTSKASDALTRETLELKSRDADVKGSTSASSRSGAGNGKKSEADGHRLAGDADERSGNPVAAVGEYEHAARIDASEENYFAWGTELLLHKAPQQAAEVFLAATGKHPRSARILAGLGAALYASGSFADAAQRLCQASDLDPDSRAFYVFLGEMEKATNGPLPCAEEELARFARENPADASANYFYAVSVWKQERAPDNPENAHQVESLLERAVSLNPQYAPAYLELGKVRAARGDFAAAIQVLTKAVELDGNSADAHYQLGLAYKRNGEQAKAEQEFAAYKAAQSREAADLERQRRQLRQFLIVLKDQAAPTPPAPR